MKTIKLQRPQDLLVLDDKELGAAVRVLILAAIEESKARANAGKESARRKMGHPITIDGREFASRAQARQALGMSFAAFAKKYPSVA
jgi:hypothetical protein